MEEETDKKVITHWWHGHTNLIYRAIELLSQKQNMNDFWHLLILPVLEISQHILFQQFFMPKSGLKKVH